MNTTSDTAGVELDRRTTAEQIAAVLRKRIFAGTIQPGTSVREIPLAEILGVSRNTLREALRALAMEGLIKHNMHRGVTVTLLTEEDVIDIFRTREHIELLALNAIGSADRRMKLKAVAEALQQMAIAEERKDWQASVEADLEFHMSLVGLLGRRRLNAFFRKMLGELRLALIWHDSTSGLPAGYLKSHQMLYDLILSGNQQKCRAAVIDHLKEAEASLRAVVSKMHQSPKQLREGRQMGPRVKAEN